MIFHHTLLKMYKPPKPHQAITSLMHQIQMILGRCMFLLKVQSIFQIHMMLGKLCEHIIRYSYMTLKGNRIENNIFHFHLKIIISIYLVWHRTLDSQVVHLVSKLVQEQHHQTTGTIEMRYFLRWNI